VSPEEKGGAGRGGWGRKGNVRKREVEKTQCASPAFSGPPQNQGGVDTTLENENLHYPPMGYRQTRFAIGAGASCLEKVSAASVAHIVFSPSLQSLTLAVRMDPCILAFDPYASSQA